MPLSPARLQSDDLAKKLFGFSIATSSVKQGRKIHTGGNKGFLPLDSSRVVAFGLARISLIFREVAQRKIGFGAIEIA